MRLSTIPLHRPPPFLLSSNFSKKIRLPNILLDSYFSRTRASFFKSCCIKDEDTPSSPEGFSLLRTDVPYDIGSMWSSLALYVFSIHVPLSFGGLSIAAKILHEPVLDPQLEAILILAIQSFELSIVLLLLKCPGKPEYDIRDFFHAKKSSEKRSCLVASTLGFGFIFALVLISSNFTDTFMDPKDVNNTIVKEILSSGSSSTAACILVYCIITPLLEEIVYRGFLITSLVSKMRWPQAVIISSIVFSAVHFSGENFLQLLIVGVVLGCSYCWTGNLVCSLAIHSLYNAMALYLTFIS